MKQFLNNLSDPVKSQFIIISSLSIKIKQEYFEKLNKKNELNEKKKAILMRPYA